MNKSNNSKEPSSLEKRHIIGKATAIIGILVTCVVIASVLGYGMFSSVVSKKKNQTTTSSDESLEEVLSSSKEHLNSSVLITAAGDVLMEEPLLEYFEDGDWMDYTEELFPYFKAGDLTIASLDEPIGGEELEISGSGPAYNAPEEAAENLMDSEIDFLSLANSHAMDRGFEGIKNTQSTLSGEGIAFSGTYATEDDAQELTIKQIHKMKVAILSYTSNVDREVLPEWAVNQYGSSEDPKFEVLLSQIEEARRKADAVIVCINWGDGSSFTVSDEQRMMAQRMADEGVDVIIGNNPHTVQPAEWLTGENGRQVLCFYSLGNLVASAEEIADRDDFYENMYQTGVLAQFALHEIEGNLVIEDVRLIPFVNHFEEDYSNFKLMKLKDYTDTLSEKHARHQLSEEFTASYLKDQVHQIFDSSGIHLLMD